MTVIVLTSKVEFEDALADNWRKLIVIYFHSACDERCEAIRAAYESLSVKHTDVVFLEMEVNRCKANEGRSAKIALETGSHAMDRFPVPSLRYSHREPMEALCALRPGCGITELPTFLFYKEELTVDKYCGTSENELESKILNNK